MRAALMNGISSHVYDFDDTTPKNYMHPTSPVASALFAYASANRVSGHDFMEAFITGFEAEMRIGNAVYPAHYDVGWHITGTAGIFGAAAAIGKLLGLSVQQMIWAIGLAATQAAGIREMFGSMAKSFHPGRAAQNGYESALLAQVGFTAGIHGLEGPARFPATCRPRATPLRKSPPDSQQTGNCAPTPTSRFPPGIVNHPTIEESIQLHNEFHPAPESIVAGRFCAPPPSQTSAIKPTSRKDCKGNSPSITARIWLKRREAVIPQYTDETVNDHLVKRAVLELLTAVSQILTSPKIRRRVPGRTGQRQG